ncbi:MAG: sarcosine oxidase subunit gamma [Novosphingobium sp.]|nr:sarcosine oxidase subunit gamma [Novosphingobium sp.]
MADGLTVTRCEGLGIATVMGRKGVTAQEIGSAFGGALVDGPAVSPLDVYQAVGTGPATWLLISEAADADFAGLLAGQLSGLASVSDQSSGYEVFELAGPGARTVLQRGAAIDFHPDCFRTGSVATTVIAHIGVVIWQVSEVPAYRIACLRSYGNSFDHWLQSTVASL